MLVTVNVTICGIPTSLQKNCDGVIDAEIFVHAPTAPVLTSTGFILTEPFAPKYTVRFLVVQTNVPGSTTTVVLLDEVHPLTSVTVTVYIVFVVGITFIDVDVAPVLQI